MALLELRNTPRKDTNASPAEMMFARKLNTGLPNMTTAKPVYDPEKREKRRQTVKRYYDKSAHDLPELQNKQAVLYKKTPESRWRKGEIVSKCGNRSYLVQGGNGATYRRNRVHLRPTSIPFEYNPEPTDISVTPDPEPVMMDQPPMVPEGPAPDVIIPRPVRNRQKPAYLKDYVC